MFNRRANRRSRQPLILSALTPETADGFYDLSCALRDLGKLSILGSTTDEVGIDTFPYVADCQKADGLTTNQATKQPGMHRACILWDAVVT